MGYFNLLHGHFLFIVGWHLLPIVLIPHPGRDQFLLPVPANTIQYTSTIEHERNLAKGPLERSGDPADKLHLSWRNWKRWKIVVPKRFSMI